MCKSEYRWGFTTCSDCGATLVDHLPSDSDPDAMEILWAGQDTSLRSSICEKLDAANIPHEDDSVESQFMPAFRQSIYRIQIHTKDHEAALQAIQDFSLTDSNSYLRKSPGFILDRNSDLLNKIGVPSPFGNKQALAPVDDSKMDGSSTLDVESEDDLSTQLLKESDDLNDGQGVRDDQIENFDPDEAISQVWSGPDREMAQNIVTCLREVGIGSVVE